MAERNEDDHELTKRQYIMTQLLAGDATHKGVKSVMQSDVEHASLVAKWVLEHG